MAKIVMNLGVFAGIMNPAKEGRILLRRRVEEDAIIPGKSFRGNWELPGGGAMESEKISYDHAVKEMIREVEEEAGIKISTSPIPEMFPVLFRTPNKYRLIPFNKEGKLEEEESRDIFMYDLAQVTPIITESEPTIGETIYVSPEELEKLAEEFVPANREKGIDGKGLVSGKGKRMHCMALAALCHSPNQEYARQVKEMLAEIQKGW